MRSNRGISFKEAVQIAGACISQEEMLVNAYENMASLKKLLREHI